MDIIKAMLNYIYSGHGCQCCGIKLVLLHRLAIAHSTLWVSGIGEGKR
jgi:hypothetical protein